MGDLQRRVSFPYLTALQLPLSPSLPQNLLTSPVRCMENLRQAHSPEFHLTSERGNERNDFFIVYRESKGATPVHWDEEGQGDSGAFVR